MKIFLILKMKKMKKFKNNNRINKMMILQKKKNNNNLENKLNVISFINSFKINIIILKLKNK